MLGHRPSISYLRNDSLQSGVKNRPKPSLDIRSLCAQIRQSISPLVHKPGVYSSTHLKARGFEYTDDGDTARCEQCGLEVSNWTLDMDPWIVHSTRSPNCGFVCSIRSGLSSDEISVLLRQTTVQQNTSTTSTQETPRKRQKTELIDLESPVNTSVEADLFRQARRHTFSHWPHRSTSSIEQMIKAGFFACNVDDRVMCIYCNIICDQWTPHVDEPCEVHRTISPQCQYVKEKLLSDAQPPIVNDNRSSTSALARNNLSARDTTKSLQFSTLLCPSIQNGANSDIPRSSTSSSTMSIADKIMQDFFYSRIKHDETCADCNKALQNMGSCDNQMTDFARWFVHCVHIKRYSADQVYQQIQECKQAQRARAVNSANSHGMLNANPTTDGRQSLIPDESTSSRLVTAQLGLQIPQQLLDQHFSLSILQRIWGNEIQIKHGDSILDIYLLMACIILQKQIDHIDGKKERIEKPSVRMEQIRQQAKKEEAEKFAKRQATARLTSRNAAQTTTDNTSTTTNVKMTESNDSMPFNPCVLCLTEEKRLACIPCGHFAACVPCGHSLRSCPICGREITQFVRIYA